MDPCVGVIIYAQHSSLPWALSMAVMPPTRYSAAPTQEDSPQKSMVQSLHTTLHAPQPPHSHTPRRQGRGLTHCRQALAAARVVRAGVATLLSRVSQVLCHWGTSGGRKGVVRRRTDAAHTSLLARGLTPAPNTMTHPPATRRLGPRNFFPAKISLRLGNDPHASDVMTEPPEIPCCLPGEYSEQTGLAGTKHPLSEC